METLNQGLMQDIPLLISSLLEHAETNHADTEIITRLADGSLLKYCYRDLGQRSRKAAKALQRQGIAYGDVVGTLAWNNHWHMECFYAISGIGAVCHTVNPRLFEDQIQFIINHANDRILMVDPDFIPLLQRLEAKLPKLEKIVVLAARSSVPRPDLSLPVLYYEELIDAENDQFMWPAFDERTASGLCYTSGTTGNPKGVLYSHRSTVLHAMAIAQPDNLSLSSSDCVMPVAPLYHAQSWGLPYGACMVGAKFILPGRHLDAPNLVDLIRNEGVTVCCGVPTIWTMLLEYAEHEGLNLGNLERLLIGGTALPSSMRDRFASLGISAVHLWGMTETSPMGTISRPNRSVAQLSASEQQEQLLKQGRIPYGVQLKVVGDDGQALARDGKSSGDLWIKGPWVAAGYLHGDGGQLLDEEGYFPTGDVATIDPHGFMKITDRSKDVIKSGGEWISSIEIEDIATRHPAVSMAAVVAAFHHKWDERPVLLLTLKEGFNVRPEEMLDHLSGKIASWWMPDKVEVIAQMPMTATGKIRKLDLRDAYWNCLEKA